MTNLSKTSHEKRKTILQKARKQMDEWRAYLNKLDAQLSEMSAETQAEYEKQLAELRLHWQQVESKFTAMNQAGEANRESAYSQWRDTAVSYNEAFARTTNDMKEYVPLGWLQGFTDKRSLDSEGWAEGFGKRPEGSEGFAEGMGHKGKVKSKGWSEGYDQVSRS